MAFYFHPFRWQRTLSLMCLVVILFFNATNLPAQTIGSGRFSRILSQPTVSDAPQWNFSRRLNLQLRNYYFNDFVPAGFDGVLLPSAEGFSGPIEKDIDFEGFANDSYSSCLMLRPDDQIWLVNGRNSHHFPDAECLTDVVVFDPCQLQWVDSDLNALVNDHSQQKSLITVIYSHGDRTDEFFAVYRGLQFYQNIFSYQQESRPPIRYVIWSWQSEREHLRPGLDFQIKAIRSRVVGSSLANLLSQFPNDQMVLVGYSLGCQAFLEALGTELSFCQPADLETEPQTDITNATTTAIINANVTKAVSNEGAYRLALIAPVLQGNYVADQRCRWPTETRIAQLDIFENRQDYALRIARKIGRRTVAGGDWPISCLALNGNLPAREISMWEVGSLIGHRHSIVRYSQAPIIRQRISELVTSLRSEQEDASQDK